MPMLTVHDAMRMPIFEQAELVAGVHGQSRVIRRVHIIDLPRATFEWAKGGELLLTSGAGLHGDVEAQRALVPQLVSKGLAGLVVSLGRYFTATPATIRDAGNRLDFPIIELPSNVSFIDVTETLFSRIISDHFAMRDRAEDIQRTLHSLVLEGGTLQRLAEVLAHILQRSVVIENVMFEVLATAQVGKADPARMRSLSEGRAPPDLAHHLIDRGIYRQLLDAKRPVHVPAMPDLGMVMKRIVAPIIVAHQIMGFMWLIAGKGELTDLDELALEHAATVAALIMFKEQAVRQAEITLRGDFLEQLFNVSDARNPTLVEQARKLDFKLDLKYQVLVAHSTGKDREPVPNLFSYLERHMRSAYLALVVPREARVVVILQAHRDPEGDRIAQELVHALRTDELQVLFGIGRAVGDLSGLRDSYEQAVEALEIALAFARRAGAQRFDDLGVLHWVHHLPPKLLRENRYLDALRFLATYDKRHHQDLLTTLEMYLDLGSSVAVAERLHLHRNTLSYRLERIQELLGLDLGNPHCRMNLYVALKSYRLHNSQIGPD